MDPLYLIAQLPLPFLSRSRIPRDLFEVTSHGEEVAGREVGVSQGRIERIWGAAEDLYRTGVHPALQICLRHRGAVVLHRALGHARGNAPGAARDAHRVRATTRTPFNIFSASKAVTAMVVHKLAERGLLHLGDPVCEYVPEFAKHGKRAITLQHILAHRAGMLIAARGPSLVRQGDCVAVIAHDIIPHLRES